MATSAPVPATSTPAVDLVTYRSGHDVLAGTSSHFLLELQEIVFVD